MQKINDLTLSKEKLFSKTKYLKEYISRSILNNNNQINKNQNLLDELSLKLEYLKIKLNKYEITSIKNIFLLEYFLSKNQDDFLSLEQINNIFDKKQNENEFNLCSKILVKISNKINEIEIKVKQIKNFLFMLNDDKNMTYEELINLLSYKETIDTINKLTLNNIINNKNERSNVNVYTKNIKLFKYELDLIDSDKLANKLTDQIFGLFEKNNNYEENDTIKDSSISFDTNLFENSNIEDKEISLNISSIIPKEKSYNNKNLKNSIKEEFNNFIQNKNGEIFNLLENLSMIIIINIKNLFATYNIISDTNLKVYLSYILKSLYYEKLIENEFQFINKEYEIYNSQSKELINEYQKSILIYNKKQKDVNDYIKNHDDKLTEEKELTEAEKIYLNINKEYNELQNRKKEVIKVIEEFKKDNDNQNKELDSQINIINEEINQINSQIKNLNNEIKNEKIEINEKITNYHNKIREKYKKIKVELQFFKSKYAPNISLYNIFISNINPILKQNYIKNIFAPNTGKTLISKHLQPLYISRKSNPVITKTYNTNNIIIQNTFKESSSNSFLYKRNHIKSINTSNDLNLFYKASSQNNIKNNKLLNEYNENAKKILENKIKSIQMRYSCKNKSNSDHTSLMNNFNSFTPQKQIKHFVSNFDFLNNSKKNQKISKSKVIKNLILSKNTSTLTKITFCFYREYIYSNESYIKFNPLDNISDEILLKNNFIKCMMNLNTTFVL